MKTIVSLRAIYAQKYLPISKVEQSIKNLWFFLDTH